MIYITDDELGGGVGHSISEVFVTESTSPTVGKFYVTGKKPESYTFRIFGDPIYDNSK